MARGYLCIALVVLALWWASCASTITTSAGDTIKVGFGNKIDWQGYHIEPADNVVTAGKQLSSEALQHSEPIARYGIDKLAETARGRE